MNGRNGDYYVRMQGQTGCWIYAGGVEAAFTKYPVLEPSFLYGGWLCRDLRHKFLMAQGSCVLDFSDEGFLVEIEVIPLPGHSFDMAGYRMPDDTVCCGREQVSDQKV